MNVCENGKTNKECFDYKLMIIMSVFDAHSLFNMDFHILQNNMKNNFTLSTNHNHISTKV
jgi:hypothetical protein